MVTGVVLAPNVARRRNKEEAYDPLPAGPASQPESRYHERYQQIEEPFVTK